MNTWNVNLEGKPADIVSAIGDISGLPAALVTVITDFCDQATGKVLLNTAGSYARGYSLNITQDAIDID